MFFEVEQRTAAAAASLAERHSNNLADELVLVVSHADPIRAVVSHYLGLELPSSRHFKVDHGHLTLLEIEKGVGSLRLLNAPPELVRLP
jgi:broad specificity phosphatase PhoE